MSALSVCLSVFAGVMQNARALLAPIFLPFAVTLFVCEAQKNVFIRTICVCGSGNMRICTNASKILAIAINRTPIP